MRHQPPRILTAALVTALLGVHGAAGACSERAPTRATGPGPHDFSTATASGPLWREGDGGQPLFLRARVLDTCGTPVAGAQVQVLHANQHGDHEPHRWRGRVESDARGEFKVLTVFPGYAGGMARHVHFVITHPGHGQLVTRLFFKNDPAVDGELDDLALVLEEVRRDRAPVKDEEATKGWIATFEFVLPPR